MLRTLTLTVALAAPLALGATAAYAEEATTNVSYADLDLARPADARVLATRLQDAAAAVCLKANPEHVAPGVLENCINASVRMAMSRIESNMTEVVHDKLGNVRSAMHDL